MADQSFLERFPTARRSTVSNRFLEVVRAGITDPRTIASRVLATCRDHARMRHPYDQDIVEAMLTYPQEALAYAQDRIEYEAMPYAERQKMKAEKQQDYQREYMEKMPPTQKQLDYLVKLGYFKIPDNRHEASQIIDELVTCGRKL